MKGKYLITTDAWFIAPDGKQYKAAWGECEIMSDNLLEIATNRNSTNWFVKVGSISKHVIIAGCQIHYAVKSEECPEISDVEDWHADGVNFNKYLRPTQIYIAE